MKNVLIIGAGKIGRMAAHFLAQTGEYKVHVIDSHEPSWRSAVAGLPNATGATADFSSQADLDAHMGSDWFKELTGKIMPLVGGAPEFHSLRPLGGKGI